MLRAQRAGEPAALCVCHCACFWCDYEVTRGHMRSFTRDFELALSRGPVRGDSCAPTHPAAPAAGTLDLNQLLHGNALFWNPYALDHMMVLSDEGMRA